MVGPADSILARNAAVGTGSTATRRVGPSNPDAYDKLQDERLIVQITQWIHSNFDINNARGKTRIIRILDLEIRLPKRPALFSVTPL